ncbi:hypothetical protein, partial [Klebsiella pneumoniae]|uniref:hypothetical protein n=1 Tax=Klebsiella pneumoniae TaxID=573 RepID=UPI00272F3106
QELQQVKLDPGTYEQWEADLDVLRHAEEIKTALQKTIHLLQEGDINASGLLHEGHQQLYALEGYNKAFQLLSTRLQSLLIELKDI